MLLYNYRTDLFFPIKVSFIRVTLIELALPLFGGAIAFEQANRVSTVVDSPSSP